MSALYKAYVDPGGLFDLVPSTALVPNVDAIAGIAKNEAVPADAADDAVRLLRVVGPPQCIAPLVAMVGYPHSNPKFKYVAADSALKCGGLPAAEDVPRQLAVNSGEKLVGYWGDQSGVDAKDRKPEPTLGQRAKELAARLGPPLK